YQGDVREIVIRTSDGGKTWKQESIGLSGTFGDALMIDKYHGWAVTLDGQVLGYGLLTDVGKDKEPVPQGFSLRQNYPNPFNNSTVIEYKIASESDVRLEIYDVLGKHVAMLIEQRQPPGVYRTKFDASVLNSGL